MIYIDKKKGKIMNKYLNIMILNGVDIGISKIELDKSALLITDKSCKYCLQVYIMYNWKDINSIKAGEKKNIDFNEYCLSENNEPALIWPTNCWVEKVSDDSIYFHLIFNELLDTTTFMNKRGHFDIELRSLEIKAFIDYKDAKKGSIIYEF